jgi:hypothetical protein
VDKVRALGIDFPLVIELLSEHNWETAVFCSGLVFVSRNEPSVAAAQLDTSRATRVENNTAICIVVAGTESACELELKIATSGCQSRQCEPVL